ncbi:MAG TPA: type III pantothenate kinase [Rhodocyclaceae bacterium]|nr:type III pantothenate kinase [Rhodocyclaceae bacterium]
MMLCLDCGNTRLKWGLLNADGSWHARGALGLNEVEQLKQQLAPYPAAQQAYGCNVAGAEVAARISAQLRDPIRWALPQQEQCGVRNGYRDITQLGADRWVALIAARGIHEGASLVVNAGTATTIDILEADGVFRGGLILPGIELMRHSLARNTAQLPLANSDHAAVPTDTDAAIVSGVLEATVGAIERMFARVETQAPICLLSGGSAPLLQPLLHIPMQSMDDLVLRGLARIAQISTD